MTRPLELFQQELEGDPAEGGKIPAIGRQHVRTIELLGRCVCCGGHVSEDPGFCLECFGTEFCNCHTCAQIASIHRMLQNEIYWLKRENFTAWEARQYARGMDYEYIARGLRIAYRDKKIQRSGLEAKLVKYRKHPFCWEVAA